MSYKLSQLIRGIIIDLRSNLSKILRMYCVYYSKITNYCSQESLTFNQIFLTFLSVKFRGNRRRSNVRLKRNRAVGWSGRYHIILKYFARSSCCIRGLQWKLRMMRCWWSFAWSIFHRKNHIFYLNEGGAENTMNTSGRLQENWVRNEEYNDRLSNNDWE